MTTIDERQSDILHQLNGASALVKTVLGVSNGCATTIMLDCYGEIGGFAKDPKTDEYKPGHPRFKHQVRQAYNKAIIELREYESRLLHASTNRFFHVADLSPKFRKIYGDITDREYFNFWKGTSGKAYNVSRPLVTSLHNKYRISLINHGVPNAYQLAWAMVGQACLTLACDLYSHAIDDAINACPLLQPHQVRNIFKDFSLQRVREAWTRAVCMTETLNYALDPVEDKNIEMGIVQLAETWVNPDYIYDSISETLPDYEEIFRTKGEMKKALRNIEEVRAQTWDNIENGED